MRYSKYAKLFGHVALALIAAVVWQSEVRAQSAPSLANVVTVCGTPNATYPVGRNMPSTQDTTGAHCISGSINATNPSVGTNNADGPASSTQVGTQDGSGKLQPVSAANPLHATLPIGSTFAPAQIALSTSAALILSSGTFASRIVCNNDASIVDYVGPSGVTTSTGMKVAAGACWDVSHTTAAIYMVAASGTPNASGVQY